MGSLTRALGWFGLYVALVLGPLGAAWLAGPLEVRRPFLLELGVALGFVAFGLIALEFLLVARIRGASDPFGIDALMLLHRAMGIAGLVFLVGHAALLWRRSSLGLGLDPFSGSLASRAGAVAGWAVLALVASSVWRRRLRLPYELWRGAHRVLAVIAMAAMAAHVLAVGVHARSPLVRGAVLGYALLFAALLLRTWLVRPLLAWRRPWEVAENRDEGASTRTLVLRSTRPGGLRFEPGQFVWLNTGRTPLSPSEHPITIASSAEQGARHIELAIKDLGDWSGRVVPALAPGARVWIDGPFGSFTPDRFPADGFVLIAGGIGITPMRSMLLSLRDRGDPRPILLIYATRDASRALYADELAGLARELDLRWVPVHEKPQSGWSGERGMVTQELLARHLPPGVERRQVFVCGPTAMMDSVERSLARLGVPPERIQTERFDMV